MAIAELEVTYGGPYNTEITALLGELEAAGRENREPDFDEVAKDWTEISDGAKKWIESKGWVPKPVVGPFVNNVIFSEEITEEEAKDFPYAPFSVAVAEKEGDEGLHPEDSDEIIPSSEDNEIRPPEEVPSEETAPEGVEPSESPIFDDLESIIEDEEETNE